MTLLKMCVLTPLVELLDDKEDPLEPEPDLASRFYHAFIDLSSEFRSGSSGSSWSSTAIPKS